MVEDGEREDHVDRSHGFQICGRECRQAIQQLAETFPVHKAISSNVLVYDFSFWIQVCSKRSHESFNNEKPSFIKLIAYFQGGDEGTILRVWSIKVEKFISWTYT